MRRTLLLSTAVGLLGAVLTLATALVEVIPSWFWFNAVVPWCVGVTAIVIVIRAHRRMHRDEVLEDWQFFGSCGLMLALVAVVGVALWASLLTVTFGGAYPERSYTFEGSSQPVYLFESSCWPPDGKAECSEYWTEIRTPIGILPFTRTIVRCNCFYAGPIVTATTVKFEVEDTYVPDTPPALIDPVTRRLMGKR